jgi:hypothetical protein
MARTLNVRAMERKAIDDAFRGMALDKSYQREALLIVKQFAASDAEAMEFSLRDLCKPYGPLDLPDRFKM